MAEFKISRIRYTWRNTWGNGTAYNRDDVIRYGGSTWICQRQHTASTFAADQSYLANPGDSAASPAWLKMTDGYAWRGVWSASTLYNPGDISLYGGVIYLCVVSHTSITTFASNDDNWTVYLSADNWRTNWLPGTRYGIGDVVKYNGIVYRCVQEHTSADLEEGLEGNTNAAIDDSTFDDSALGLWDPLHEGIEYKGVWSTATRYRPEDLVKYGGSILRCTVGHVAGGSIDTNNFVTEFPGFNFYQEWNNAVYYAIGDIVRHGGYLYAANTNNYQANPAADDTTQWNVLSKAINFLGTWNADVDYKIGDLVRRGGNLYVATANTTNDGSSLDYLDAGNWELVTSGQDVKGEWTPQQSYGVNDIVVYLGNTYTCNQEHTASNDNFPGDNGSGFFYWDLLLQAGSEIGLSTLGDLLTFDLNLTNKGDNSTFGLTGVAIGLQDELLTVNSESSLVYRNVGEVSRVVFVATHGLDDNTDSDRGYTQDKPWRTVRFACQQVDDGYSGNTTVEVLAGVYEEIGPISIPSNTVVLGNELRTTTIKASPSILSTVDTSYHLAMLVHIDTVLVDIFNGLPVTKSSGNTVDPVSLSLSVDNLAILALQSKVSATIQYIQFYLNSVGSAPTMTGTNTALTTPGYTNVAAILSANSLFLQAEAAAFLQLTYPAYQVDQILLGKFMREYVIAWAYDVVYPGNYKSLLAARYYRNSVLGTTTTEDLFYCRNGTGLRNCTLKGIESTLTTTVQLDVYQRPLGGAYVSLDPGWGPADTRVWITSRSPYIQGVTTIGTGAVGQKIDGSLHNGGNRSIVSNDFTQVISDGIGAWVTNNGRAELVSVFTYYAHIGYLAEDGGKIRATNGNCSYGSFGAVADGVDASEVPAVAAAYTRAQQAIVAGVFAGDFVDEIQILEWENLGENYTSADAVIIGAGVNASVKFEDFRDDAVFEARLLDRNTTGAESIGGSGYVLAQNSAQGGNTTSITIASNDQNTFTQYAGMRLVIVNGPGTGQYGYITAYDTVTKVVSISRESDDQPGWDHLISGKPPAQTLLTTTLYRIEPRVIFEEPTYSATEITVSTSATWSELVYGESTETFTNIAVNESGTGTTVDASPALARFNVVKTGRIYTITINNGGAGYEAGQLLTIDGDLLGGISPANDLSLEVLDVSDDSTNSVLQVVQKTYGTGEDNFGAGGRFVAVSTGGDAAMYSEDGTTWIDFTMPTSGNWKCLAAGNNRFVAIRKGSAVAASSFDGATWTTRSMPFSLQWNSCIYGGTVFLAVATDSNSAAYSLNGTTWTTVALPTFGDSTLNEWVDIAYGKDKFVVVANSNNTVAVGSYNSTLNTWSWTGQIMDVIADSSQKDWVSIAYGNDRFVAISSTGNVAYSYDSISWLPATMPSQDGSTAHNWKKIRYAQGVFFAVGDTGGRDIGGDPAAVPTNFAATSFDGVTWVSRTLATSTEWQSVAFGNPYIQSRDSSVGKKTPIWVAIDNTNKINTIQTGARALGRVTISSGIIRSIRMWDPGSGYLNGPACTIVDPNNGIDAIVESRTGDGVLGQPSWFNRGLGYRTNSTTVTISGDGYANVIPRGKFFVINDLEIYPGPGANLTIGTLTQEYTLVAIEPIGPTDRGLAARIRVSPEIKVRDNIQHLTPVVIRTQFSQCRITGHDFLDIGTGNFEETNYPELYSGFYSPEPQDEVIEINRGRVFYTSTDQSGNFRAGELFAVEQSTGIVTISADFFDLGGLTELRLGGIRVGGTGAVVREFSTDPLMVADSNNIVPTQRAIRAYLANRLSVGGSEIAVGSFIAGTILIGPDRINNTAGLTIIFPLLTKFDSPNSGIRGTILAQTMFHRSF